jgi:hypothetical protein
MSTQPASPFHVVVQRIDYGFDAVLESRKQMDGDGLIHKPVVGRAVLVGMRTVNHPPPVKKRMADAQQRYRGADRDQSGKSAPQTTQSL